MSKVVTGFIIEADKKGYFYHRSRMWIAYDTPEKGYVWPENEVKAILEAAKVDGAKWELKPAKLHPATFIAPVQGITAIDHPPFDVKDFGTTRIYSGDVINNPSKAFTVQSNVVGTLVSL